MPWFKRVLMLRASSAYRIAQLSLAFLAAFLLTACGDSKENSLSENSIIYCSEGSPETFNPQLVTSKNTVDATSHQFYNRLLTFDAESNSLQPSLAKSWHVTKDGKIITFYLRKDVDFHNTTYFTPSRKFNADDVLFSFNRILHSSHNYHKISGGKYPYFARIHFEDAISYIEKVDNHTVRFHLSNTNSKMLANLASDFSVILSKEYAQQLLLNNTPQHIDSLPVGTGPFKLKNYKVGSFIRYTPHEQYWKEKISIAQLVFDITPSNTGRLTKLLAGECDIVDSPIAHQKIRQRKDLTLDSATSYDVSYLGFNTQKAPLDNKNVRQAIYQAINKKAIIETIYLGQAKVADNLFPQDSWAHNEAVKPHKYNTNKANQKLINAGYSKGFELDLWVLHRSSVYNPDPLTMASLIKTDLEKIGIKVNIISKHDADIFQLNIKRGVHQAVLAGWSTQHSEPDDFFSPLLGCNSEHGITFWCHEEFNHLLATSLKTKRINKRKQLYFRALDILIDEAPIVPIAHPIRYQARSNKVKGAKVAAFGGLSFQGVTKK